MLSVAEPERPAIASGPLPDQKALLIPYAGAPGHFTIYSYAAVLNGQVPAATFKNKYVLVGSWGSGLGDAFPTPVSRQGEAMRSEEHTSELQSLMRISYAVFCLKKKKTKQPQHYHIIH